MVKVTGTAGLIICIVCWSLQGQVVQAGTKYRLIYASEHLGTPCQEYPDKFLSQVLDMSNITFDHLPDDKVHTYGYVGIVKDLPKVPPVKAVGQVFKKERGQWVETVYSMRRDDFCRSLFNPVEIWYNYTLDFPKEYRTCDIHKGPLKVDFTLDTVMPLPDRNAEGDYKLVVKFTKGDIFVCTDLFFALERA